MTKTKTYFLFNLAIFFCVFNTSGQKNKIDSLFSLLKKDKLDTNKVNHLNDIAWEIMYVNPDSSIKLSARALSLSKTIKWENGVAFSTGQLGSFEWIKGDYPMALRYFMKALTIYEKLGFEKKAAAILSNIGTIYLDQKDTEKALSYYLKALKIVERFNDENVISSILGNLGNAHAESGNYSKALSYFLRGLSISEHQGDKNKIATDLANIGFVYTAKGDYQTALDYGFRSLTIAQDLGDKLSVARNLGNIGSLYTYQKNYGAAEKYLKSAIQICNETRVKNEEWQFEISLSNLYTQMKSHTKALTHYKKAIFIKDSLFTAEKSKEITRREINYDFEKKELVVKELRDKKNAVAKAQLKRKELQRNYFLVGFLLIALIALFIFRRLRGKQHSYLLIAHQKQEVERKNAVIENKNKEILDSIHYAKRIQIALLPSQKVITRTLNKLQNK